MCRERTCDNFIVQLKKYRIVVCILNGDSGGQGGKIIGEESSRVYESYRVGGRIGRGIWDFLKEREGKCSRAFNVDRIDYGGLLIGVGEVRCFGDVWAGFVRWGMLDF